MDRATRCPGCGTVFRVVEDQLKVSAGWVRCGRCMATFDAREASFDLDDLIAAALPGATGVPPDSQAATEAAEAEVESAHGAEREPAPFEPSSAEPEAMADARSSGPPAERQSAETPGVVRAVAPEPASAEARGEPPVMEAPPAAAPALAHDVAQGEAPQDSEPAPAPGFLQRAERAERWRTPRARARLALAALLLALALAAQMALHYRDRVAAHWPQARPALQAACDLLGCTVQAPRRIETLSVESSTLARAGDGGIYRLQLVLRNRAATEVRMPAIELALTDLQGQTVVRRVLTAADLGASADRIAAGGEVLLQAGLDPGARPIAGYSVEPFYP
jgi:predicted Zn finger-like uncharacterized protein